MPEHTLSVYSTQPYDREYFNKIHEAKYGKGDKVPFTVTFHTVPLSPETAELARDSTAVCVFVNDTLDRSVLETLKGHGVKAILLRCAGYNNVDLDAAKELGIAVANVPSYSPEAVAEFAVALLQTMNRKTHRAYNRVREGNFQLHGLLGYTLSGKTVGVIGTGKIGVCFARIMHGFGCKILAYDVYKSKVFEEEKLGKYVELDELLEKSDFISLHCPLLPSTKHIINKENLDKMKDGVCIINTSRGALLDTKAVVAALKRKKIRGLAIDVYEHESDLFFEDHSADFIEDDLFNRLNTFPNVLITGHQGFFTVEAISEIAEVTMSNMEDFMHGKFPNAKNSLIKED